ncbi:MAG: glycosyltransferase family 9 protein [Syntrophales bacterium]|nr:glycosyltransferase family 9 protein [Syntrophales bacterium]
MFTYRKKILLDRSVGIIVSIIISIVARIVGFFLRRDHSPATDPKAVIVAKFVGLGSIIHTSILCQAIKQKFPHTNLYYLTTRGSIPLMRRIKGVDEILYVDDRSLVGMVISNIKLLLKLWQIRPELYFDLEVYSSYSSILSNLSLARNRYGFYRKSVTFKKGLFTHPIFFNTRRHITEIYAEMGKAAGIDTFGTSRQAIAITSEDEEKASAFLPHIAEQGKKFILLNPNASELMYERRWPQSYWIIFINEITEKWTNYNFVFTGTVEEKWYVDEIYRPIPDGRKTQVLNMAGKWDLGTFLALLTRSQLLITVDSGPLHMAYALGVPTISLWGPVEPDHYAPREGNHIVLYKPPYCSPCLFHADLPPCGGNNVCMKNITPTMLVEATDRFLHRLEGT